MDEEMRPETETPQSATSEETGMVRSSPAEVSKMMDATAVMENVQRYVEIERGRIRKMLFWASAIFVFTALVILVVFLAIGVFVLRNSTTATERADQALDKTAAYIAEVAGISARISNVEVGNKDIRKVVEKSEATINQRNRILQGDLEKFQKWVEDVNAKSRTAVISMESKIAELERSIGEKEKELTKLKEEYTAAISSAVVRTVSPEVAFPEQPAVRKAGDPGSGVAVKGESGGSKATHVAAEAGTEVNLEKLVDSPIEEMPEPQPPTTMGRAIELSYPDGDRYKGEFQSGLFHGWGVYTYHNGDVYHGEFRQNMKDGMGMLIYSNGDRYIGEFKNDMKEGKATILFANGDKFGGHFKSDAMSGVGRIHYQNGNRYAGSFSNGMRNGHGLLRFPNGDEYIGEFRDDSRDGNGIYSFANGEKYIGEFKNGQRDGRGRYMYVGGEEYVGEFREGRKNGKGVCVYPNGVRVNVTWADDELVEETPQ